MCGHGEEGVGRDGWVEEGNDLSGLIYCVSVHISIYMDI